MEENEVEGFVVEMVVYMEGGMVRMASQGLFLAVVLVGCWSKEEERKIIKERE